MTRIPDKSTDSSSFEYYLNVLEESKFWKIILRATGNVENLNSKLIVKRVKESINELGELIFNKEIDVKLFQKLLKYSDEELFDHFDAAITRNETLVSQYEIANLRKKCDDFYHQFDILFKFYGRYCSDATDLNIYSQQMQNPDKVNMKQIIASDYWAFHEKILASAERCYRFKQSQTFLNIFEFCFQKDAAATKVEYIAQKLIPTVFEKYDNLCKQFKDWERLKCTDAALLWNKVTDVRAELDLMNLHEDKTLMQSLVHLSKIPYWTERLKRLATVTRIFTASRGNNLLNSIHFDNSTELGQINSLFDLLNKNFSRVDENCWELIKELSNAEDFMKFLIKIADHDITNLINGVDDHSDEKLIQESTVSSLIQVKQCLFPLMSEKKEKTIEYVLDELLAVIKKNANLGEKIALCNNSNKALQNMYYNILNRGEVTKEKIKNAVTNGTYTFARDEKGDKCLVSLEYISKNKVKFNLNEILDLRGRALLIAQPKTTVRINENEIISDSDMEKSKNIMNEFVAQADIAQEIFNIITVLIEMGHFSYRKFEKKLRGTDDMKKYFKFLKETLEKWLVRQDQPSI
jgi:hypothetical protein